MCCSLMGRTNLTVVSLEVMSKDGGESISCCVAKTCFSLQPLQGNSFKTLVFQNRQGIEIQEKEEKSNKRRRHR